MANNNSPLDFQKEINVAIKKEFGDRIKQSFLIEMKVMVLERLPFVCSKCFPNLLKLDGESMLKGNADTLIEYEVCRNIVGIHRHYTIFLSDEERGRLQSDSKYKQKLLDEVINQLKIRNCSGKFARSNRFIGGDDFFFFPLPYKLFAMCVRANVLLCEHTKLPFFELFALIFNKGLSALCLLENNMFDSVYPICRAIIEIYIKTLVIMLNPSCYEKYKKLCDIGLNKGCSGSYSKEFSKMYDERKFNSDKKRLNYLHYGFVDDVNNYSSFVSEKHYSFSGLIRYLNNCFAAKDSSTINFYYLEYLYNLCHPFTHGTVGNTGYPLAYYFDIVDILSVTIEHVYRILCEQLSEDTKINDVDIIASFESDISLFKKQKEKRSPENFQHFYKTI